MSITRRGAVTGARETLRTIVYGVAFAVFMGLATAVFGDGALVVMLVVAVAFCWYVCAKDASGSAVTSDKQETER